MSHLFKRKHTHTSLPYAVTEHERKIAKTKSTNNCYDNCPIKWIYCKFYKTFIIILRDLTKLMFNLFNYFIFIWISPVCVLCFYGFCLHFSFAYAKFIHLSVIIPFLLNRILFSPKCVCMCALCRWVSGRFCIYFCFSAFLRNKINKNLH